MKSIFIVLAIVTFFELPSSSRGLPAQDNPRETAVEIPEKPIESHVTNIVIHTPVILEAISELPPEKVAQMMPRLKALAEILNKNCLGQLFAHIYNLCTHYKQLQTANSVTQLITQLLGGIAGNAPVVSTAPVAGNAPVTYKQKTQMTFVYAPQGGSEFATDMMDQGYGGGGDVNDYQREVAATTDRIAQDAMTNLEQLKSNAKASQAQIEQELMEANSELHSKMQATLASARQDMRNAVNAVRSEGQRMYVEMRKALNWLREELRRQVGSIRSELLASRNQYKNNVEQFRTSIKKDLGDVNETVQRQVTEATDDLKNRVNDSTAQLNAQIEETRARVNSEAQTVSDAIDAQLRDIRAKMQAAMDEMRKEMRDADAELKKGMEDSFNGAKGTQMNEKMRQEMEQSMAEMRNTTQEMREKMEKEIEKAIRSLTTEIESILAEVRNAKNAEGIIPAVSGASASLSTERKNVDGSSARGGSSGDSKGEELPGDAAKSLQNGMTAAMSEGKNLAEDANPSEITTTLKQSTDSVNRPGSSVDDQQADTADYQDEEFDLDHEDGFETIDS